MTNNCNLSCHLPCTGIKMLKALSQVEKSRERQFTKSGHCRIGGRRKTTKTTDLNVSVWSAVRCSLFGASVWLAVGSN